MSGDSDNLVEPWDTSAHEIEQLVYQLQQVPLVETNPLEVTLLGGRNRPMNFFGDDVDIANDRVQRGAQFVADVAKETQFVSRFELGVFPQEDGLGILSSVFERFGIAIRQALRDAYLLVRIRVSRFAAQQRSEERRVGKECRSRWAREH